MLNRLSVFSIVVTLLVMSPALAEPANEASPAQLHAAADAFDRGRESYKSGDMVAAAESFEQADSRAGSPIALEYAIRARDKAGQLDRAATLSALARKRYPDETGLAKLVEGVLGRARGEMYELSIDCSEPCELVLDGKLVHGESDFDRVVFLSSGSHLLRAGFSGARSASRSVEATAGEQGQLQFEAPADAPAAAAVDETQTAAEIASESALQPAPVVAEAPRSTSGWSPAVFWVGTGLTATLGAITLWSGLDTVKNPGEEEVQEACRNDRPDCDSLYEDGRRRQARTNLLLGVTAGVGLTTILIGAAGTDWGDESAAGQTGARRSKRNSARSGISPWLVVGDGALLGAEGRF